MGCIETGNVEAWDTITQGLTLTWDVLKQCCAEELCNRHKINFNMGCIEPRSRFV